MPLGASRLNFLSKTPVAIGRDALTITANDNAQISTAQSKFGGSSAYFDGTNDYIITEENDVLEIAGDFTIEWWFRWDGSVAQNPYIINNRSVDPSDAGTFYAVIVSSTPALNFFFGGNFISSTGISSGTWYHAAYVRSGSTVTSYLSGISRGTLTSTTTLGSIGSNRIMIGCYDVSSRYNEFDGYVDEVRVSKVARYTGNFTPPTAAFTNDADTVLLLHMDGTNGSTTFTDDNS